MFVADTTLLAGQNYLVHSNIFQPTEAQLRNAGVNYAAWVSDHYLELPADLPPAIGSLARQITAGSKSPYDKAVAITNYLPRKYHVFNHRRTLPPGATCYPGSSFVTKTGFCNYYATAEVVLLRSLGIPARMAVGFAQGEYDPPNLYTVREKMPMHGRKFIFPAMAGWNSSRQPAGLPWSVRQVIIHPLDRRPLLSGRGHPQATIHKGRLSPWEKAPVPAAFRKIRWSG